LTNLGWIAAYLPLRHEKIEAETHINDLVPEMVTSTRGDVTATRMVRAGRLPRFQAVLHDGTGRLDLVWFNAGYLRNTILPGTRLRVQGKVKKYGPGLQLANPKWELLSHEEDEPPTAQERMRPVYSANDQIKSPQIEKLIAPLVPLALPLIEDHLTEPYCKERELIALSHAYQLQHQALDETDLAKSQRRLAYDELLMLQLGVAMKRAHLRESLKAPKLKFTPGLDSHIRKLLPFTLTASQDAVVAEIAADLSISTPANRLIQGDVGSGKTVVALYAMLMAVASGSQASLMAPTEILAEQHYLSITNILKNSRVRIELLTGTTPAAQREPMLERLAKGEVDILIGTHALLTQSVKFKDLAVAIVDEQHRFGVVQRAGMRAKASDETSTPHVLVMTATPIPRTLAITLFGDLDISSIKGLPPGRKPIKTTLLNNAQRTQAYQAISMALTQGRQAYIVAPAIDPQAAEPDAFMQTPPEATGPITPETPAPVQSIPRDVRSLTKEIQESLLPDAHIAVMHGQLSRAEREAVMERFRSGKIDVLVATTIIEVGVDVPNASIMIIEQAERFGLAQLHQLRGRIGRGEHESACYLISDPPSPLAQERLDVIVKSSDGFELAEKDLELRGPGQVFGIRQSGLPPFKVADLTRDRELLSLARRDAIAWIKRSPKLAKPEEKLLLRRIIKAYGSNLGLGDVG